MPAEAKHNLKNTGDKPLRLYTLYGPPIHIDHLVQGKKSDAEASHEVFDGAPTVRPVPQPATTQFSKHSDDAIAAAA